MKNYLLESILAVNRGKKGKKHQKHERAETKHEEHEEDEKGEVEMPKKDFRKEHKHLLKVLKHGKKPELRKEFGKQKKEVKEELSK